MLPIEGYGCIGDSRSLALVGVNGSIDWLCWPRFDSAPVFWSLLDSRGGSWSLAPRASEGVRRHYLEDTNVLCTDFDTATGQCRVLDFMPVSSKQENEREAIERAVEEQGYNGKLGYTQTMGGSETDASLLQLSWYGYRDAADPRMQSTFRRIVDQLRVDEIFLLRNSQSLTAQEGAFGICGFWAVEFLARGGGSLETAIDLFDRLVRHANDLGLFAEELDPHTGAALGNFPQAFTHVGLINAALALHERQGGHPGEQTPKGPTP